MKLKSKVFSERGSLRRQILVFTMSIIIVCSLVIGASFLVISNEILMKNQINSTLSAIDHAAYTVEQDLDSLRELMDYFFVDRQIQNALSQPVETNYDLIIQQNSLRDAMSTYERLDYAPYLNCVIFYNSDGEAHAFSYMDQGAAEYVQRNEELGWYQAALESEGHLIWGNSITEDEDVYLSYTGNTSGKDISVLRALRDKSYTRIRGVAYVSIQPSFFSVLQENNGLEGMKVYLYDDSGSLLNPEESEDEQTWGACLEQTEWQNESYRYCVDGNNIIYEYLVDGYDYRLIAVQPMNGAVLMDSRIMFLGCVMLIMMLVVAASLWIFLTRRVMRPVNALSDAMRRVHTEGLAVRAHVEGSSEFCYLSDNLNYMLNQIQTLMDNNLEKERAVQEAEHKAVIAQMNPHFVYNALFAIRMMAVIQKADNIRDMVDALWRMLKNSTSRAKEDFTLADEIQNVKDYIHILSATNVQKFEVIYDIEEDLYKEFCLKFLIQPVVENAIMHGVLPKQGFSTIQISVVSRNGDILITISNDGLPIPEERLKEVTRSLFKDKAAHKGLGLSSIQQRLKLLYGDEAGLMITSSQSPEKTIVSIHYPRKKGEQNV